MVDSACLFIRLVVGVKMISFTNGSGGCPNCWGNLGFGTSQRPPPYTNRLNWQENNQQTNEGLVQTFLVRYFCTFHPRDFVKQMYRDRERERETSYPTTWNKWIMQTQQRGLLTACVFARHSDTIWSIPSVKISYRITSNNSQNKNWQLQMLPMSEDGDPMYPHPRREPWLMMVNDTWWLAACFDHVHLSLPVIPEFGIPMVTLLGIVKLCLNCSWTMVKRQTIGSTIVSHYFQRWKLN